MFRAQYVLLTAVSLVLWLEYKTCLSERVSYFSMEHPVVTFYNKKYMPFLNVTSRRPGRSSFMYYVNIHFTSLYEANNTSQWDFYFYEFYGNAYHRSFLEIHLRTCDLILKDKFIGFSLGKIFKTCPVPAGTYAVKNYSIPLEQVPHGFPFTKGRIYVNSTMTATNELIVSGYCDIEIKEVLRRKPKGDGRQAALE